MNKYIVKPKANENLYLHLDKNDNCYYFSVEKGVNLVKFTKSELNEYLKDKNPQDYIIETIPEGSGLIKLTLQNLKLEKQEYYVRKDCITLLIPDDKGKAHIWLDKVGWLRSDLTVQEIFELINE